MSVIRSMSKHSYARIVYTVKKNEDVNRKLITTGTGKYEYKCHLFTVLPIMPLYQYLNAFCITYIENKINVR